MSRRPAGTLDNRSVRSLARRNVQESPTEMRGSLSFQSLWNSYRSHVRRRQVPLQLVDDLLTRLIFWTPHTTSNDDMSSLRKTRWREVLYGLISVHRLAIDLALVRDDEAEDSYGTTLRPTTAPIVPATAVRIALTVTHNLMPTILELARSHHPQERQSICRLWLERVKFVLRMILLTSYWKQIQSDGGDDCDVVAGLLQHGGMYRIGMSQQQGTTPTVANAQALKQRREYVGRRTGRRVLSGGQGSTDVGERISSSQRVLWLRLMFGEILRLYRPLLWAKVERDEARLGNTHGLWKTWILTFVMEVSSLQCLSGAVSRDNVHSQAELSRRRMKVLLYFLRSPAWDKATEPRILQTAALLRRVPLLGRLVESYLWEFLLYWKHPFVSEEE